MSKMCEITVLLSLLTGMCSAHDPHVRVILYKDNLIVIPESSEVRGIAADERGFSTSKTIGSLIVTRSAQIKNLFVSGGEQIGGNLTVGGNETIHGDMNINGCLTANCIIANTITPGSVDITGNLDVAGNVTVGGNVTVDGCLITSCISGNPVVQDNLTVNGCLAADCFTGGGTFKDTLFSVVDATDQTKKVMFDVQGSTGTTTTFITNPTTNRFLTTTGYDGTLLASDATTGQVFIGANTTLHGSNAGIQYSTTVANRAQLRVNQYGNNTGVPGITAFKSRGATIGSLAAVQVGDVIFRDTAIGVTSSLDIPISGTISINVTAVPSPGISQWIGTEFEVQLVPNSGPFNGRKVAFKVSGDGIISVREGANHMAGLATLVGGTVTVANANVPTNARIMVTVQPGTAPSGFIYVSAINPGVDFTITSTSGADTCTVYYQIYQPTP